MFISSLATFLWRSNREKTRPARFSIPFTIQALSGHSLVMAVGSNASTIRARASPRFQQSHIPDSPVAVDAGRTTALIVDLTGEAIGPVHRCGFVAFWAVGWRTWLTASHFADSCCRNHCSIPAMQYMKPVYGQKYTSPVRPTHFP